VLPFIF